VAYRSGGSLRPHTHHDSAWSGVYYVSSGTDESAASDGAVVDAGYLQLLDPRPAAIAWQATAAPERMVERGASDARAERRMAERGEGRGIGSCENPADHARELLTNTLKEPNA
jgi:hypothetical protein